MSIGKMIAEALAEAFENTKKRSAPIPMNFAAISAHTKHKKIIDELWPAYKLAKLELERLHNRLEEERQRWAIEMQTVQPELKDVEEFEINDEGTHIRLVLKDGETAGALATVGVQPEWAKELAKDTKPN